MVLLKQMIFLLPPTQTTTKICFLSHFSPGMMTDFIKTLGQLRLLLINFTLRSPFSFVNTFQMLLWQLFGLLKILVMLLHVLNFMLFVSHLYSVLL